MVGGTDGIAIGYKADRAVKEHRFHSHRFEN